VARKALRHLYDQTVVDRSAAARELKDAVEARDGTWQSKLLIGQDGRRASDTDGRRHAGQSQVDVPDLLQVHAP
jgi:hypothetical protein